MGWDDEGFAFHCRTGSGGRACGDAFRLCGQRSLVSLGRVRRFAGHSDKPKSEASISAPDDVASLPGDAGEVSDPFEKMNRSTFERNMRFNHSVIYPAAKAYHNVVPEPVRNSIDNFVSNLDEPFVFANDLLQLRLEAATTTVGRFAINSTVGVGGLFDVATKQKLPQQSGDFGQTLYVWGMRNSPYLVLPVIGPTNVRDLIGTTVELLPQFPRSLRRSPPMAAAPPTGPTADPHRHRSQQSHGGGFGRKPPHQIGPGGPDGRT